VQKDYDKNFTSSEKKRKRLYESLTTLRNNSKDFEMGFGRGGEANAPCILKFDISILMF